MDELESVSVRVLHGCVRVGPGHTIPVTVNTITVRGTVSHRTPQKCSVVTVSMVLSRHHSFFLGKFKKKRQLHVVDYATVSFSSTETECFRFLFLELTWPVGNDGG